MLVLATAILPPDGTGNPSLHVFNRHTLRRLCFALSLFRGGNRCPNVLQRVRTSAGKKDFHEAPRFGFPCHCKELSLLPFARSEAETFRLTHSFSVPRPDSSGRRERARV